MEWLHRWRNLVLPIHSELMGDYETEWSRTGRASLPEIRCPGMLILSGRCIKLIGSQLFRVNIEIWWGRVEYSQMSISLKPMIEDYLYGPRIILPRKLGPACVGLLSVSLYSYPNPCCPMLDPLQYDWGVIGRKWVPVVCWALCEDFFSLSLSLSALSNSRR